ncbi:MAG: phytase [Acidimicrobiia bacterium]
MWRRSPRVLSALVVGVIVASLIVGESSLPAGAQTTEVTATVETDPVPSGGDAADDPAIWLHPTDPSSSTVIGTDKEGGLAVYDLSGRQIQYLAGIRPNNVDIRHGFPLAGQSVDLVVTSDRGDDAITIHRVDPQSRQLVEVAPPIATGLDVLGVCLYRSPETGSFYVFVTSDGSGPVRQWQLSDGGGGGVTATQVRDIATDSTSEGCVADDDLAYLYVAEEDVGIWKYEAEPNGGSSRVPVDQVGSTLEADVEGLTIYYGPEGAGYLIASSQGSGEYVAYERMGNNQHITNFQIVDSAAVDGTSSTDGIDVMSAPLGAGFPNGLFVAQDGDNDSGNQNFKLVPWDVVAGSPNAALAIEPGWNPRGDSPVDLPHVPLPSDISTTPVNWSVGHAAVSGAEGDGLLAADGTVESGTSLVFDSAGAVAVEFSGLTVPAGSGIRSAHVQFTAAEVDDSDVVLSIHGVLDGSGEETEAVTWAPAAWGGAGERGMFQQTPDLSVIIRQMVASPQWEPGGSLTLVVRAEGLGRRAAVSFDADPTEAPALRLEYSEGR